MIVSTIVRVSRRFLMRVQTLLRILTAKHFLDSMRTILSNQVAEAARLVR